MREMIRVRDVSHRGPAASGLYEMYVQRLYDVCFEKGFGLFSIGSVGPCSSYPLFAVCAGGRSARRSVCFVAGIHGEEPAGPLSILRFLKESRGSDFRSVSVLAFPVVNPYGFDIGRRENYLGLDLNRHFQDDILVGENKAVYSRIRAEDILFLHTLHEDADADRFYLYGYRSCASLVYRKAIGVAGSFFPIDCREVIAGDRAFGGLVLNDSPGGELESRMVEDGVPFVMASETPGRASLEKRVDCGVSLMKQVMDFCGLAMEYSD